MAMVTSRQAAQAETMLAVMTTAAHTGHARTGSPDAAMSHQATPVRTSVTATGSPVIRRIRRRSPERASRFVGAARWRVTGRVGDARSDMKILT
ncbi:hypothetical protein [Streptomyces bauhiniae]|uniref:hypothetical protein n=1 Tax=Streptomyces bauhiniae TaxID=2340725 RepID=UPI0035DE9A8A